MIERPAFDPRFRVVHVAGDGIFMVADDGKAVVLDAVLEQVASLIDGRRTSGEIADALEKSIERATTYYALISLEQSGLVREGDAIVPHEEPTIDDLTSLARMVSGEQAAANLVVVDGYLTSSLEKVNRTALRDRRAWMIAKAVGGEIWVGPAFIPGKTACWSCLAHWLRTTRPVNSYLERRSGDAVTLARPATADGSDVLRMAAALANDTGACDPETLVRFDPATGRLDRHAIRRRPQCAACGDPGLYARRLDRFLLADDAPLAIPAIAVTAAITKLAASALETIHVYIAAPAAIYHAGDSSALSAAMSYRCMGSGTSGDHALTALIGETIERYSGTAQGDEPSMAASMANLSDSAIHPNACMLFSDAQYAERIAWNARGDPGAMVPEPFDPAEIIDWTPVWSLSENTHRFLPTSYLYRGSGCRPGAHTCVADSNGCAAGVSLADAIIRGFLELVERDAIALWWYPRRRCPSVDLSSLSNVYCRDAARAYRSFGRELWVLDITTDLGVPAYAAVSRRVGRARREEILFGFGAHFDAERAITHAITEMNQLVACFASTDEAHRHASPAFARWLENATVATNPFLLPDCTATQSADANIDARGVAGVERCRDVVERHAMNLLVLDQTRADVSFPTVKVIVPGLRPAAPRFAPGRLRFETEAELNSFSFFL